MNKQSDIPTVKELLDNIVFDKDIWETAAKIANPIEKIPTFVCIAFRNNYKNVEFEETIGAEIKKELYLCNWLQKTIMPNGKIDMALLREQIMKKHRLKSKHWKIV